MYKRVPQKYLFINHGCVKVSIRYISKSISIQYVSDTNTPPSTKYPCFVDFSLLLNNIHPMYQFSNRPFYAKAKHFAFVIPL